MKKKYKRIGGGLSRIEKKALRRAYKEAKEELVQILFAMEQSASGTLIQGKLGFRKGMKDADFAVNAKAIYDALSLNAGGYFNPPFADLDKLLTLIGFFNDAVGNVKLRVLGAGGAKKTAKNNLYGCLKNALSYINSLAWTLQSVAEEIITGAKMVLRNSKSSKKQVITASYTKAAGEALLQCIALKVDGKYYAANYSWQMSSDGGKTWVDIGVTSQAKLLVTGLTHGDVLKFRKRTSSTKFGIEAWCTPVDFTVN